ncbi:poly(rc)-binding protein 3 [Phtheirospermum japonicum]|uniref:Poly(Rc)-binding protein 3 n=1 Tax=Phtheirospermum japonicum TaxID=374723 RepID=A0A830B9N4_9LAMI|nr:poly(rc)-binding protein 3 [Phtheirospermum japonicum]
MLTVEDDKKPSADSGVHINFKVKGQRQEDRVIIISSKDSDNTFSDAENALHQIVSLMLQEEDGDAEASKVGVGHVAPNTVRILIAGCQAGGVIGTSGQNIVNLRITSGASITILSHNQLPPCASAHETDRIVQMSGEIPAVLRAVVEIGCQLSIIFETSNLAADYATMDIMVLENLVGGLIGRFGANISRIRNEFGANIKVALAKLRVDEYVYAELMRQAGGQVPQTSAGQHQQYPSQPPVLEMPTNLYQGYGHPHSLCNEVFTIHTISVNSFAFDYQHL